MERQCQDALEEAKTLYNYALNEYFFKVAEHQDLQGVYHILKVSFETLLKGIYHNGNFPLLEY